MLKKQFKERLEEFGENASSVVLVENYHGVFHRKNFSIKKFWKIKGYDMLFTSEKQAKEYANGLKGKKPAIDELFGLVYQW